MDGEPVGAHRVVQVGGDAVDEGVRRLVGDDVLRQRGMDPVTDPGRRRERQEAEASRGPVVEGVAAHPAGGRDDELGAAERPHHGPAKDDGVLDERDGADDTAEHVYRDERPRLWRTQTLEWGGPGATSPRHAWCAPHDRDWVWYRPTPR